MNYIYENISELPNLNTENTEENSISGIHYDIENSEMTNKSINWCEWNEDTEKLTINYNEELSQDDKDILDTIVTNN